MISVDLIRASRGARLEVRKAIPRVGGSSARPLLFVHGGFHAAWCWDFFLQEFAHRGFPSYALSIRGHGRSSPPMRSSQLVTLDEWVEDIRDAVQYVKQNHHGLYPLVAGHSAGGGAVQKYAEGLERNDLVPGIMLFGAFPPKGAATQVLKNWIRLRPPSLLGPLSQGSYTMLGTPEKLKEAMFAESTPLSAVQQFHSKLELKESGVVPMQLCRDFVDTDKVSTNCEVLIFGGAQDKLMDPYVVRELTGQVYARDAVIVEDVAHDMMLDKSWKNVVEAVTKHEHFKALTNY